MNRIEKMTEEQERQMIEFREEWRKIGLATGPADMSAVAPVIHDFYSRIGKPPPAMWRCDSPLMIELWINIFDLGANLGANLGDNLRDNLWANLWDNLWANLRANLGANLGDNLGDNLRDNLGANLGANLRANLGANLRANLGANLWANLWANLGANLGDNLRANLWANLRDNLRANLRDKKLSFTGTWMWGSLDSYWIAYYLFPHTHLRPIHTEDQMSLLNQFGTLAEESFWIYPFANVCFVSDRPSFIGMDARYRLHCDDGPAIAFADGWREYYVHGVHVPAWIIEQPGSLTVSKIDAEPNAEVRRVMIDRYTAERYLRESAAELVSEDRFGRLWKTPVAGDEPIVMVELKNSTPEPDGTCKTYWLRVKPTCKTAHEAVASTWVDEKNQPVFADYRDYQPIFES